MTIKTVFKYMAVVGVVAVAASSAHAQSAYINIGTDSGGPIIPVYGPVYGGTVYSAPTYGTTVYSSPTYSAPTAGVVVSSAPADTYINIGTDSGGPIIPAYGSTQSTYYATVRSEPTVYYGSTVEYTPSSTYYAPSSTYYASTAYSQPRVYYVPAGGDSGSPLIPVYY